VLVCWQHEPALAACRCVCHSPGAPDGWSLVDDRRDHFAGHLVGLLWTGTVMLTCGCMTVSYPTPRCAALLHTCIAGCKRRALRRARRAPDHGRARAAERRVEVAGAQPCQAHDGGAGHQARSAAAHHAALSQPCFCRAVAAGSQAAFRRLRDVACPCYMVHPCLHVRVCAARWFAHDGPGDHQPTAM